MSPNESGDPRETPSVAPEVSCGGCRDDLLDSFFDDVVGLVEQCGLGGLDDSMNGELTAMLVERGANPERTGWWCGRPLPAEGTTPIRGTVETVTTDHRADDYLDVFEVCGWFEPDERAARRDQLSWDASFRHVVMLDGDAPVGAATELVGTALEVVDVTVRSGARRHGIGRALVGDLEQWGTARGAEVGYAAPSPDGAELFRALGFTFARVQPDVCFYFS